jgi:hypothetical protein
VGLQILSSVWGKKHVELFKRTAIKSLSWPKNLETLQNLKAKWNIFADEEHHQEIVQAMPTGIHFNLKSSVLLRDYIDQVQSASIWQIKECLKSGDKLLLAPPDSIFGDGTVQGLWTLGRDKGSCVVVPHPRVLPSIGQAVYGDNWYTNAELVSISFRHLHKSWSDAEDGHPMQNSFVGGVEWTKVTSRPYDLYAVTHRLPTVYLADFTDEDLQYFKSASSFGNWDHVWPSDILVPRGRQRFCGSSDACFVVEITEEDKNVPPILEKAPTKGFWREHPHNKSNAQITAIFRGE